MHCNALHDCPAQEKLHPPLQKDYCLNATLEDLPNDASISASSHKKRTSTCLLEQSGCPFISHVRLIRAISIAR